MASSSSDPVAPVLLNCTSLDSHPELWYACVGELVHVPPVNSEVIYFVQGHMEHVSKTGSDVDFEKIKSLPHSIICRVDAVNHWVHSPTDEMLMSITLVPPYHGYEPVELDNKPVPFSKKMYLLLRTKDGSCKIDLTWDCAKTFFPQFSVGEYVCCKDLHGFPWMFLLETTSGGEPVLASVGWNQYLKEKFLEAGDFVILMRDRNGELRIGIRRGHKRSYVKLDVESAVKAAKLVSFKLPCMVPYFPRISTLEYVVKVARVRAAIRTLIWFHNTDR